MARRKAGPVKSAQTAATNWKNAMQAPQTATNWVNGVQQTSATPMTTAASAESRQKYAAGTAAAAQDGGALQMGLQSVSDAQWKAAVKTAGGAALTNGANKKAAKQLAVAQKWQPIWQQQRDLAAGLRQSGASYMEILQQVIGLAVAAGKKAK